MSLGLAITFGLMGIINMAHGEMLMLGSYTAYVVRGVCRHPPRVSRLFFPYRAAVVSRGGGGCGVLMERGILRFLYGRPLESLLITWGIGMILQQGARLYFGDQTSVSPPTWLRGGWEIMPGLIFPYSRMFIIALSLFCLAVVYWLLYRSDVGLRVRSVMQNRDMASCMGISARTVDTLTFAMGTALAGLAGCALSLIGTVDPEVGKTYIVDSFLVVVLGGSANCLAPYWPHSVLACPTNSSNRPLGELPRLSKRQGGHFSPGHCLFTAQADRAVSGQGTHFALWLPRSTA